MPTKFTQDDGSIVWVSHVPDWETNPEGGFYAFESMARDCEESFADRTGSVVEPDAWLGDLIERDREGWGRSLRWNHGLVPVFYVERLRWQDHKEALWRVKHWGVPYHTKEKPAPLQTKRLPFPPELKDQVWLKTNGHCSYCGLPLLPFTNFTIDHVRPVSDGGTNGFDNLVPCCKTCNSRKHAMPVETFRARCGGGPFWIEQNGGTL